MSNQYKEWTHNEIIESIKIYYEKNNKTPRTGDFKNINNLPSFSYALRVLNCCTINEILALCNLIPTEIVVHNKINKEWALEQLKKFANLLNRRPTVKDFKNSNWQPTVYYYQDNFGGLINACVVAGITDKPLTESERIEISVNELINLANKLKRCPYVYEYEELQHNGFVRRDLEKHLEMKYNDICRKYIPQYEVNMNYDKKAKEELINDLIKLKEKLGRTPMMQELNNKNNGITYHWNVYKRIFNKPYNEIIKDLGWGLTGHESTCKSDDELLEDFYNLFLKNKRIPFNREIDECIDMASSSTYIYRFESIKNVCSLLNIDYEDFYKSSGTGKVCFDKLSNICKSSIELKISNFLIDNDISFKKETRYLLHKNDRRRYDWTINVNNQVYHVEYAGLYNSNSKSKICKVYNKNIKRKVKDLYQNNLLDKCIFIFPWDIKNKSLEEIFSLVLLNKHNINKECAY
jgi:hypothetical protein